MDSAKKKQLMEEYKNRRPEMGVISFKCLATGESFLELTTDYKASINSLTIRLSAGMHPNKRLQALWQKHGVDGFERVMLMALKYDDPKADHHDELEELRELCLAEDELASKCWL